MINFANPLIENSALNKQILDALEATINSGNYILGQEVYAFEKSFSQYVSSSVVVGCASGTDALVLSLSHAGIGAGHEVIVPSHTASPTISAIMQVGAKPVFCDIEKYYYTIDFEHASSLVTNKTRALIAVHLYGGCCDIRNMRNFKKNHENIIIIEDCAQAVGTTYNKQHVGSLGDYGAFSFFPTKNLGAIGDAGAVTCNIVNQEDDIRKIAQYGWNKERNIETLGRNSRLDEIQAAILRVKMLNLKEKIAQRQYIAKIYSEELDSVIVTKPVIRQNSQHSFHLYVVQVDRRDECLEYLKTQGINCGIHYKIPVHKMSAFQDQKISSLKNTEDVSAKLLSLPLFPGLSDNNIEMIIERIKRFYKLSGNKR
ncbi:DegT/DnrJ/EryC1/StrS family aminotransferase [Planktomarina temperata]|nr:DegT/DnrJ/EryC1/StrS family aminotransferase [Planktomarina temperata]